MVQILTKLVNAHRIDRGVKLSVALWAYHIAFKVGTRLTPFRLTLGLRQSHRSNVHVAPSLRLMIADHLIPEESLIF